MGSSKKKDWIEVTLSDLVHDPKRDIVDGPFGSNLKSSDFVENGIPVFKIQNIKSDKFIDKNINFVTEEKAEELKRHSFVAGDLIITKLGNPLGLCCEAPKKYSYGIIVADLLRLRPNINVVNKTYLKYGINSNVIQSQLKLITKGTTRPRVNLSIVRGLCFPLPPLPEQRAIVARIEELFSELDHSIANLKSAQSKLEIYRQAVLKKAFEGGLTEEWRRKNKGKDWMKTNLGSVAEISRGKSKHRPRNDSKLFGGVYPFIQTGDVKAANGGFIREYSQTYSEFGLAQSKLWPIGTLCLTIAANIADTAFLGIEACFPDSVVGIKSNPEELDLKFLNFLIQLLKAEIDSKASATAQKNINVAFLEKLEISFPSIEEQFQIVQEIESRFSVADKLAETIQTNLEKAESLSQSILKKAFEGELLSEVELEACRKEAGWEPAEKLLERIKSEIKKK